MLDISELFPLCQDPSASNIGSRDSNSCRQTISHFRVMQCVYEKLSFFHILALIRFEKRKKNIWKVTKCNIASLHLAFICNSNEKLSMGHIFPINKNSKNRINVEWIIRYFNNFFQIFLSKSLVCGCCACGTVEKRMLVTKLASPPDRRW